MNFKNEFVTHGKIHFFDLAIIEMYGSKSNVTDFGTIKITVVKITIYKSHRCKTTSREITISKNTSFEFLKIKYFFGIYLTVIVYIKEVLGHV